MTFGKLKVGAIFVMDIDGKSTKCVKVAEHKFTKYNRKTVLMALPSIEVLTFDASAAKSGYNAESVDKTIAKSKPKIGSKEAKAIHGLLKGRTAPDPKVRNGYIIFAGQPDKRYEMADYTKADLTKAFKEAGIKIGASGFTFYEYGVMKPKEGFTYVQEGAYVRRNDGLKSDDPILGVRNRPDLWPTYGAPPDLWPTYGAPPEEIAKAEDKLTEALARVAACKHEHAELAPSGHVNCYACGLRVNPPSAEGPVTGYADQHGNVVGLHAKKTKL